ncbi:MAG: hypothetical protein K8F36_01190 [Melioribacteraceae bacterium]|nr:hypothetical protein [Melioribacteraceae bacterium]MCO6472939.1 hypothetical protein [Melioribacteraceae bacterium]MDD3557181.1 hypothetical protein [Melioribacteraceae bacterium]
MRYIFLIIFSISLQAQSKAQIDEAKNVLNKLIKYSLENNYEPAAELIIFDAIEQPTDKPRTFNWNNPEEQKEVIRTCKKIRAFIKFADDYEIVDAVEIPIVDSELVLELKLSSAGKETVFKFLFVEVDNKILLKEIL